MAIFVLITRVLKLLENIRQRINIICDPKVRLVVTLRTILLHFWTTFDNHHTCRFAKTNTYRIQNVLQFFPTTFNYFLKNIHSTCETWSQQTMAGQRTSYVGTTIGIP